MEMYHNVKGANSPLIPMFKMPPSVALGRSQNVTHLVFAQCLTFGRTDEMIMPKDELSSQPRGVEH